MCARVSIFPLLPNKYKETWLSLKGNMPYGNVKKNRLVQKLCQWLIAVTMHDTTKTKSKTSYINMHEMHISLLKFFTDAWLQSKQPEK
jgi:hypothetical protein